jgi:CHASE2 domain-containing sensor protein/nitrogen-specific signal transduction histidine kinase
VALVSTLVIGLLAAGRITARADNVVYDVLAKAAVRPPNDAIVILAIDNRSIEALGRWPWPRARHAALLQKLAAARPKAIAYDVLFVDPDADPANDLALAGAVKAAAPVVLPLTFDVPGDNGAPFRLTPPVAPLRAAASGLGQVNLEFDPDGVVRRVMLAEGDGRQVWPHMMEETYRIASGHNSPLYLKAGPELPRIGGGLVRSRPMLIPFAGPPGHFRAISFVDALKGETPPQFLHNKIVLVGATADGLGDRYATPLSGGTEVMSGVEVQANVLDALMSGRAIRPLSVPETVALSLAPLWILLLGFLRLRPRANMFLGLALMLATLALSAVLLLQARIWAPPAAALAGLVLVYPLWSWRRLEATSAYMLQELRRFADEPDLAPAAPAQPIGDDVITREVNLMQGAVGRMRELRRFVADTLQGLPDATLVMDLDERVTMANRAADLLFEELIGALPQGLLLSELLAAFEREDEALTARGATYQLRRTPLHSTREQAVGWIVRLTDISALKAASRQREQVLQLLTHDMRSPQVSILALLDSPGEDRPTPALAKRIEGYARRTLGLADDFVHLARAESAVLETEPLNFADLVVEAADDLWPQSSAKGVTVSAGVGDAEYLIMADRSLMTRALINLIGNAIKYTDAGGRVDCTLSLDAEAGQVICAIADTGRGMPPAQLERLFERFHRGGAAKSADGVGLGLAFVQTVVERHGGTIACQSAEGRGSTFTLILAAATGA